MHAKVASSQELTEALAAVWAHLNRRSSAELFKVVDELDSSFSQVKMLFLLEDGGEHSVKEIATHLGLSVPAASRAVDGLVERGFVTRRESAADRRSRLIALHATTAARSWTGCRAPGCRRSTRSSPSSRPRAGQPPTPRCSPSWKGSLASDPTASPLRGEPPLVDARGDVLRAVHGDARQHRRRTSRCRRSSAASTPRCRRWSGRSTPTRSPSPCCSSPAGGSATSSAAARCS